jgi:hypothetical protein
MNNVLQNKFSETEFAEYVSNHLPDFQPTNSRVEVRRGFTAVKQIGESPKLDLVIFAVTPESSIHARMEISKQSYALLKIHPRAHALIAYYSDEADAWRLSLITTQVTRDKKGVKETVSNPRRFSYVLGPGAKVNTPTKYLITKGQIADLNDLKERFSLEVVNKDFYREISNLFTKLTGGTHTNGKSKKEYEAMLQLPSVPAGDQRNLEFAVRIIGRVIFSWFLREKRSAAGVSLMPKELLSLEAITKNPNYYHSILEPIFFEVLNKHVKSRKDRYVSLPFSSIPYLNGGLFSPDYDDYFSYNADKQAIYNNTVVVPDEWVKEFFAFLETYNFTIDENVSFDEELSIDPEMLGRIFENLLAEINPETGESARENTGSYYTPRAIVDYMVDESLFVYLAGKTSIDDSKLRAIISYDLEDNLAHPLNDDEFDEVVDSLSLIKILDPACGSGAFPIGALQKVVFILQQVDPDGRKWFEKQVSNTAPEIRRVIEREFANKNFNYIRKLGVIRENIFGVDIQPIATEISRLRCFLTLVVDQGVHDELENRGIEPLPNLDFKFVTANTLIQLPGGIEESLFKDRERIEQLKDLRNQFFSSTNSERQRLQLEFKELQNQMLDRMIELKGGDEITRTLSTWSPFSHKVTPWFDPEWMFGIEGGFDIVIGNPPYINVKRGIDEKDKERYKRDFLSAKGQFDLFTIFIERGLHLTKDCISYIVPKPFINNENYALIRKMVLDNGLNKVVIGSDVFEAAAVESCIFLASKRGVTSKVELLKFESNVFQTRSTLDKEVFYRLPFNIVSAEISIDDLAVIRRLSKVPVLGEYLDITRGVEAGKSDPSIRMTELPTGMKLLTGENVTTWRINYKNLWIDFDENDAKKFKPIELYAQPKILIRRVANQLTAALDRENNVVLNTVYCAVLKDAEGNMGLSYLTAVLNSSLIKFWFHKVFAPTDKLFPYIRQSQLEYIPVKVPSESQQKLVSSLVDQILGVTMSDDYLENSKKQEKVSEYEKEIDQIIYKLYGLTAEEVVLIEKRAL